MNPKVVAVIVVVAVVLIGVIVLLATSFKKLASDQVGLAYDTINKDLAEKPKSEGLHNGPPGFQFIIFPSVFKSLTFSDLKCLNSDGVVIELDVTYQYKARPVNLNEIVMNFKDFEGYKEILKFTGESALHEACSHFNTSQFQSERGAFQEKVQNTITEKYEVLHCQITDLQVSNIARPAEYESAIRSKERAREDIKVAENEQPRLKIEAETEKLKAATQARIILEKARSDARILEKKATAEAEAIIQQYQKEAEAYAEIMSASGLGFSAEGFISYMGVRVISSAKNPVYVGLESPAKSSYTQN